MFTDNTLSSEGKKILRLTYFCGYGKSSRIAPRLKNTDIIIYPFPGNKQKKNPSRSTIIAAQRVRNPILCMPVNLKQSVELLGAQGKQGRDLCIIFPMYGGLFNESNASLKYEESC